MSSRVSLGRVGAQKGTPAMGRVTTSGLVVAANQRRISLIIVNNSSTTVYLATGPDVLGNGIPLAQNASFTDNVTTGPWYASAATVDVRFIEVS